MSKPRRQHFHPKSFLKPFADQQDDKYFVEIGNVNTGEIKYPISIADICISKNLYTLPDVDENKKYAVEKFYAEQIDSVYPEVYQLLTDPKVERITEEQRLKILNTTLSLYFRNARFLNAKNQEVDELIERMANKEFGSDDAKMFMRYGGRHYNFTRKEIPNVKEKLKLNNRLDFINQHLQDWQDYVRMKTHSQIAVSKIVGEVKLITSDNPVRAYNRQGDTDDIFNPANAIQLPIDQEHLLWISPNGEEWDRDMIYRQVRDKWFAISSNHSVAKYASDWVISSKNGISSFFKEMQQYDKFTPENEVALENIKTLATELDNLLKFMEENGGPYSSASKQRLRELKENPAFANDPQFQIFYKELMGETFI
jgi:hypothetical protein